MILSFHVFILHSGYLSLGCSHTVAFMRAVHHGCKDPNGQLPHIPKSDPIWEAIHDGWWWHVISSQVEDAIPKLASFVQMALNASNSIHKAINELEVACQAATIFQQTQSLDQAMITISQGDLQCRSSLKAIRSLCDHVCWGPWISTAEILGKLRDHLQCHFASWPRVHGCLSTPQLQPPHMHIPHAANCHMGNNAHHKQEHGGVCKVAVQG